MCSRTYTKYLISGGIGRSYSCIYWVLRRYQWSLCWRGESGVMPPPSLSHKRISIVMTWCPPQKVLHTPLSGAPHKCFQSGPALAKARPGANHLELMEKAIPRHVSAKQKHHDSNRKGKTQSVRTHTFCWCQKNPYKKIHPFYYRYHFISN